VNGIDPKAGLYAAQTAGQADGSGLADRLRASARDGDAEGLREAAQQFEAYFIQTMLKEMRKTGGGEDGLFAGSEMETFHGLFDQEISERVSEGRGVGLAPLIERSMARAYADNIIAGPGSPGWGDELGAPRTRRHLTPALAFPEGRTGFSWPLPDSEPGRITSSFGSRRDPFGAGHRDHGGLDVGAPKGTPILAMADGKVVRSSWSDSFGNVVEIEHDDGVVSRYAHQDRRDVRVGDVVTAGEQIGTVGSSGRSTGSHLHLEVHVAGQNVDPHAFLEGRDQEK
jgi:murein DD-endopeptidase MepM/ murein hydrolase activator NlpD